MHPFEAQMTALREQSGPSSAAAQRIADALAPTAAIAEYADLVAERDALADRGRAIDQELAALRETVVPELKQNAHVTRLQAKNGREVTMWAERDPEDGSMNVEWTIAE